MNSGAKGHYYDGQTARAHAAELRINGANELELTPALRGPTAVTDVRISNRVGNTPRRIEFTDGALFETADHHTVDQWLYQPGHSSGWIHRLESKTTYALGALVMVALFVAVSVKWGVPWSSQYIAQALPESITVPLGDKAVESMDKLMFHPTQLAPERITELQHQFGQLLPSEKTGYQYQLLFRGGGRLGANALAFPNGTIIMTDELVALAEADEELQSILLHEIGHLQHHHSLRQIIAHTSLAVLTSTLTGDITAAGSLAVGAPNVLMEASFSRQMETEADTYALNQMQYLGLATDHFANIMERLEFAAFRENKEKESDAAVQDGPHDEVDDPEKSQQNTSGTLDFFSSHPLTKERISRFRRDRSPP